MGRLISAIKLEKINRDCDVGLTGCCWKKALFNENLREGLVGACGDIDNILICNGRLVSYG